MRLPYHAPKLKTRRPIQYRGESESRAERTWHNFNRAERALNDFNLDKRAAAHGKRTDRMILESTEVILAEIL